MSDHQPQPGAWGPPAPSAPHAYPPPHVYPQPHPYPQHGQPAPGPALTGRPYPTRHRPWSTALLVLHWVQLATVVAITVAVLVSVVGGVDRTTDLDQTQVDGWIALVAGVIGVVALVLLSVVVTLLLLTIAARRRADRGRPTMLLVVACVAAALGGLSLLGSFAGGEPVLAVINGVLSGIYTSVALGTAITARR